MRETSKGIRKFGTAYRTIYNIYIPILQRCQNALYDSSIVIFVSLLAASLVALCARIRLICVFCCERLRQFVEQTFQSQPILW